MLQTAAVVILDEGARERLLEKMAFEEEPAGSTACVSTWEATLHFHQCPIAS